MSARPRPPTEESTETSDQTPARRPKSPTRRGVGVEVDTPTTVAPPRLPPPPVVPAPPVVPPPPVVPKRAATDPIHVISLKADEARSKEPREVREVKQHKVQIRSLSDLGRQHATPAGNFGYLAPPHDPHDARARRRREYMIWGSLVVILGCAIMLVVWFLAR